MIRAILFDMDGVLFDTERLYMEADRQTAAEMGRHIPEALLHSLCGAGPKLVRRLTLEHFGQDFDFDSYMAGALAKMAQWADEGRVEKKPGLDGLLRFLDEKGLPRAVATSSGTATAMKMLKITGVFPRMDAVVTGSMIENGKPAPDIFLAAARELGIPPTQCAVVEDSFLGVRAARDAGCLVVMVPDVLQPTPEIRTLCDAVLPSLAELPAFLQPHLAGAPA